MSTMNPLPSGAHESFPCNTSFLIPGPAGALEARSTCSPRQAKVTAIVCHPHPLYGGTMDNKVVHTLVRSFDELGLRTVRFNFRGVGASGDVFAQGVGETEDVLAVAAWVRERVPQDDIWLAGFSFGAYMALRAAARTEISRLVLVAPPVHLYPELGPPPSPRAPTLVLQGEDDDVVPLSSVRSWIATLSPEPTLHVFRGVGHFFHGRLDDLRLALRDALGRATPA